MYFGTFFLICFFLFSIAIIVESKGKYVMNGIDVFNVLKCSLLALPLQLWLTRIVHRGYVYLLGDSTEEEVIEMTENCQVAPEEATEKKPDMCCCCCHISAKTGTQLIASLAFVGAVVNIFYVLSQYDNRYKHMSRDIIIAVLIIFISTIAIISACMRSHKGLLPFLIFMYLGTAILILAFLLSTAIIVESKGKSGVSNFSFGRNQSTPRASILSRLSAFPALVHPSRPSMLLPHEKAEIATKSPRRSVNPHLSFQPFCTYLQ
ncbi:hypothetical protein L596_020003 [Steinernema carpocapsae]|uniref:Transmembrane protein n=1 Tax=Steinernema carpocapsae TaxID=34508 RepID=A0A4U5MSB3_STECR|nr:hypothetical protein L596_020003 [Steinernema carpocapsae]